MTTKVVFVARDVANHRARCELPVSGNARSLCEAIGKEIAVPAAQIRIVDPSNWKFYDKSALLQTIFDAKKGRVIFQVHGRTKRPKALVKETPRDRANSLLSVDYDNPDYDEYTDDFNRIPEDAEEKIGMLTDMGYSRFDCEEALRFSEFSLEIASEFLAEDRNAKRVWRRFLGGREEEIAVLDELRILMDLMGGRMQDGRLQRVLDHMNMPQILAMILGRGGTQSTVRPPKEPAGARARGVSRPSPVAWDLEGGDNGTHEGDIDAMLEDLDLTLNGTTDPDEDEQVVPRRAAACQFDQEEEECDDEEEEDMAPLVVPQWMASRTIGPRHGIPPPRPTIVLPALPAAGTLRQNARVRAPERSSIPGPGRSLMFRYRSKP